MYCTPECLNSNSSPSLYSHRIRLKNIVLIFYFKIKKWTFHLTPHDLFSLDKAKVYRFFFCPSFFPSSDSNFILHRVKLSVLLSDLELWNGCFSSDIFLKKTIFTSSFSHELETVQKYPLSFYCYKKGRMLLWIMESIWYKCKRNFYMIWIKSAQPSNSFCKWLSEYRKAGAGESNIKPAFRDPEEICLYKIKGNWHPTLNKLVLCTFHMKQSSALMWWY